MDSMLCDSGASGLFAEQLGWERLPGGDFLAGEWIASADRLPGEKVIRICESDDEITLTWSPRSGDRILTCSLRDPHPYLLARLGNLSAKSGKDPQPETAFGIESLYRRFGMEAAAFLESHLDCVVPLVGKSFHSRTSTEDVRDFLQRCLNRLILLKLLSSVGFIRLEGTGDYLTDLYSKWQSDGKTQLFHQRLSQLFYNALGEGDAKARAYLEPVIGEVPFLGTSGFGERILKSDAALLHQACVVQDTFYEKLLAKNGLLNRYPFKLVPPSLSQFVGLTPQVLASAFDVMVDFHEGAEAAAHPVQLFATAQRSVWEHLGHNPQESLGIRQARALLLKLENLQFVDQNSRGGGSLVALLGALIEAHQVISRFAKVPHHSGQVARRLLKSSLQAWTRNLYAGQLSTHALVQTLLSFDQGQPDPIPDVGGMVRLGLALNLQAEATTIPIPALENETTEFKSTFDWDARQGKRQPERALACLKTIAGFLNSQGGTLYIGIDDKGQVVGISEELNQIRDPGPEDIFEGRLREAMKNTLDPIPLSLVTISFPQLFGNPVCRVDVKPRPTVTYLMRKDERTGQHLEEVYVRDGHRTLNLKGRQRDHFVLSRLSTPDSQPE
ncbi:MAG: ATP-binding protein [Fimbriimonadaceae bacterium]|jgi:hypothetical protein|nr:ATP-binding protein [Fimbriimonadaceae bacterium]